MRDDVGVKGDILEGEEEEGTSQFSTCARIFLKVNGKRAHVA